MQRARALVIRAGIGDAPVTLSRVSLSPLGQGIRRAGIPSEGLAQRRLSSLPVMPGIRSREDVLGLGLFRFALP